MQKLYSIYKKQGGFGLVKQYWCAGAFWSAIAQFCLLGRSMKALELLRLTASLKTQQRLARKYGKEIKDYHYNESLEHISSRKIWIFWWQGMDNAPALVQKCYQSVKENLQDWEIVLITEHNYIKYTTFPEHIIAKLKNGSITLTHFSDLLRLELLIKHGGLWLDATVLCTRGDIPNSILNSDLFVYQAQKPGADGHATIMSSWCMYAKTNNKILIATRKLLYDYWKKNKKMADYFLLHQFFTIVCNQYPEEAKKIPPFCNSVPHILLLHLFDKFDEQYWEDLKQMTCFHKLSYKLNKEDCEKENTFYAVIINS